MKLLLHMCCGPCSCFPVKHLRENGIEPVGYFYNPNIHPYREFRHRLETLREYAGKVKLEIHVNDEYTLEEWLRQALAATDSRCRGCYELRLREAARFARANGFDCFTTTLLVSPYQKHDWIREIAEKVAKEEGIPFYYEDFRPGWQEGVAISRELELYRQPYCGCIFSEKERYWKPRKEAK